MRMKGQFWPLTITHILDYQVPSVLKHFLKSHNKLKFHMETPYNGPTVRIYQGHCDTHILQKL